LAGERKFVAENVKRHLLKEYLMEKVQGAGFGGLEIRRTALGTRITLVIERPGLVIGRRGSTIKTLTEEIAEKFDIDNPQIEVAEEKNPALNAQIMAEKLAAALERGWKFRRAGHSTVRRIMEAGAKGCQVTIAGKLTGQRHRTAKFKQGHIKFCGQPSVDFMDRGFAVAKLKPGVIGVSVWIMRPDARLPDEIHVLSPEELARMSAEGGDEIVEEIVEGAGPVEGEQTAPGDTAPENVPPEPAGEPAETPRQESGETAPPEPTGDGGEK